MENNFETTDEFNQKGIAAFNGGDFNTAILFFSKVLELNPQDDKALNNRAISYREIKEYQKALIDIDLAIRINKNDSLYFSTKSAILTKLNRQLDAINELDNAISIEPLLEYSINKIVILKKLNRYHEALIGIQAVESTGAKSNELLFYKAVILFEIKKIKEAEEIFKILLNTDFEQLSVKYLKLIRSDLN